MFAVLVLLPLVIFVILIVRWLFLPTWARLLIHFLSVIDITTSNTFQLGVFFRLYCLVHRPTVTVKKPSPLYDCLQSELIEMKKHLDLSASLFFSFLFSSLFPTGDIRVPASLLRLLGQVSDA